MTMQNKTFFSNRNQKTNELLIQIKGFLAFSFIIVFLFTLLSPSLRASSSSDTDTFTFKSALKSPDVVKILSIDGGGIRGLMPLLFLEKLEKKMGQPVSEIFDLVSGTSTGGIIALCLTTPEDPGAENLTPKYRAQDLTKIYSERGDDIFGSKYKKKLSFNGLMRPRYSAKGMTQLSQELLGDAKLSDAMTNVLVTSFETERYRPHFFNSHAAKQKKGCDFMARDVAVGTSSAPTYFKPKQLQSMSGRDYSVIDGGVVINNPAILALARAREIYPNAKDFLVVSLGTGCAMKSMHYKSIKNAGGVQWIQPLISIMMEGVASSVDAEMKLMLPDRDGQQRYFRFQPTIRPEDKKMDDVSPKHIQSLDLAGEKMRSDKKREIKALVHLLKATQEQELHKLRADSLYNGELSEASFQSSLSEVALQRDKEFSQTPRFINQGASFEEEEAEQSMEHMA